MEQYKHKNNIVYAEKFDPSKNTEGIMRYCSRNIIKTDRGLFDVKRNDYIVKGIDGVLYSMPEAVFKQLYERIENGNNEADK